MGAVFNRVTLSATGNTLIASAGQNAGDAGWQLTFAGSSWTGSVVLQQNTAPPGSAASLSSVAYFNATTGALVAAGTAITANGSFIVANTGLDLYLVYTHTAGTVQVTVGSAGGQFGGVSVAAADVTAGTFGAYSGETGAYTFPAGIVVAGTITGITQATFSTKLVSSTALATPSALAATAFNAFASTVSGAVLMGFGTTGDVTLKNRAGTTVAYVGPNTTDFTCVGAFTAGAASFTTLAASDLVSANGGLLINGGTTATGRIVKNATTGLQIRGVTGSGYDVEIAAANGASAMTVALNSANVKFWGTLDVVSSLTMLSSYIEGTEMTAPAAPAANKGRIFFQDNGAGKTQLMCIFASGAAQQVAIEP